MSENKNKESTFPYNKLYFLPSISQNASEGVGKSLKGVKEASRMATNITVGACEKAYEAKKAIENLSSQNKNEESTFPFNPLHFLPSMSQTAGDAVEKSLKGVKEASRMAANIAVGACETACKVKKGIENLSSRNKNEESTTEKVLHHAAEGGAAGALKNAARYAIELGGRKSNIVNVYDKTVKSSLGNPKWFARVDAPHGNVPYHHINVNKAVTGVKDPHIKISGASAQVAGGAGQVLKVVNDVAPVLMAASVAYDAYQIGCEAKKDYDNSSTRNTIQKTVSTVAATGGGFVGCTAGAAIGTAIFPGVGTIIGGLVGGIFGGIGGGIGGGIASEVVLESYAYDIDNLKCKCGRQFQHRRYQEGEQMRFCHGCR